MGIRKLEGATARALCASQTLTDPSSVIKELVDNSLDANATSIAIEISLNTLDIILVRDNGHGITPEDRALVAAAGCTSKLTDIDDLRSIGGTSLGFRGQALASVAELSHSFTISTRIEGEPVAAVLSIDREGSIVAQEKAPLPIGTTIKITNFLKTHPVRRIEAIKGSDKTIRKIRGLLQNYAFARPHVRLSLRVLKARNEKANFLYVPQADEDIAGVTRKIVGSGCASQCTSSVSEDDDYAITAFLPRADADVAKIIGVGAFVSVDGRPVSSSRGLFKQIVRHYRSMLKQANSSFENVKEPFLYIDLTCPDEAYDPNVEPAKDDLLFNEPDRVLNLAGLAFQNVYSTDNEQPAEEHAQAAGENVEQPQPESGSDVDGASPLAKSDQLQPQPDSPQSEPADTDTPNRLADDESDGNEGDLDQSHISVSNPWILAKLHTRLRPASQDEIVDQNDWRTVELGHDAGMPTPAPSSSPWKQTMTSERLGNNRDQSLRALADHVSSHVSQSQSLHNGRGDTTTQQVTAFSPAQHHDQSASQKIINKPFKPPARVNHTAETASFGPLERYDRSTKTDRTWSRPSVPWCIVDENGVPQRPDQNRDIRDFGLQQNSRGNNESAAFSDKIDLRGESTPPPTIMAARFSTAAMTRQDATTEEESLFVSDDEPSHLPQTEHRVSTPPNDTDRPLLRSHKQKKIDRMFPAPSHEPNPDLDPIDEVEPVEPVTTDKLQTATNRSRTHLLPLERIPLKKRVHNVVVVLEPSIAGIEEMMINVDGSLTFLDWNEAASRSYSCQSAMSSLTGQEVEDVADRLDFLTRNKLAEIDDSTDYKNQTRAALEEHLALHQNSTRVSIGGS